MNKNLLELRKVKKNFNHKNGLINLFNDVNLKIKEGELRGLSIEGYFTDRFEGMKQEPTDAEILTALNEIIRENLIKSN